MYPPFFRRDRWNCHQAGHIPGLHRRPYSPVRHSGTVPVPRVFSCPGTVFTAELRNYQCCGSGIFIPDSNFSITDPQGQKDSGSRIRIRIKEFKFLTPKIILSSRNRIRDVHPGSWSWIFTHPGPGIQMSKRHQIPDPGSRIPDPDPQHWKVPLILCREGFIFLPCNN